MPNPTETAGATNGDGQTSERVRRESFVSNQSQTAKEFIDTQLRMEAEAREVLPYAFDSCSQSLGPLRQSLFACITCNPPPSPPDSNAGVGETSTYKSAGVCYSCSISCHGEHVLVELFNKRNFVCDCGTTRLPSTSPCTLRANADGVKGVHSQPPALKNTYNHNFQNRFCGCGEVYDAHTEKGTMFQCLGLGTVADGGCGEDWWHPECLVGLPRGWHKKDKDENKVVNAEETQNGENKADQTEQQQHQQNGNVKTTGQHGQAEEDDDEEEIPLPPGFPEEDDFETFVCYKCLDANPWLKRYAGTRGFLCPVFRKDISNWVSPAEETMKQEEEATTSAASPSKKRKADDDDDAEEPDAKRAKEDSTDIKSRTEAQPEASAESAKQKHDFLPASAPSGTFSLFLKEDFREHLCHCPACFPHLIAHPQLREEEETYEPPLSASGAGDGANGGGSQGTGSLYDRGTAALNNVDRVRAIEGAMVYNHLRDKVKEFLKPFAESGQAVSAEDIKEYFEKLRGDDQGIKEAGDKAEAAGKNEKDEGGPPGDGGNRTEQSGY